MRVRVEITAKHIEEATAGARNCVLARALSDAVGYKVSVGTEVWGSIGPGPAYALSASARRIVNRFDNGATIRPCAILLDIPEEALHAHHG